GLGVQGSGVAHPNPEPRTLKPRLVTLTGSGGVGKTRLALEVGETVASGYPDGVWFVDLSALSDASLVVPAVASGLGLRDEPGRPLLDRLLAHCRSSRRLILLDNCEQVIEGCAALSRALLEACPDLRILATSRQP